jgi:hypothetical protein
MTANTKERRKLYCVDIVHKNISEWQIFTDKRSEAVYNLEPCLIISPLQSTAGHRPLQLLVISLDLRLLASSFCQPSCINRQVFWTVPKREVSFALSKSKGIKVPSKTYTIVLSWQSDKDLHSSNIKALQFRITILHCIIGMQFAEIRTFPRIQFPRSKTNDTI